MSDLVFSSASQLAKAIRERSVSAKEVMDAHLAQIAQHNLISGSADKTVKLWKLDGTLVTTLKGHNSTVLDVAVSPDGQTIASTSADQTVKLWQPKETFSRTVNGHSATVWAVAFAPQGKVKNPDAQLVASGSEDNTIALWKADGTLRKKAQGTQYRDSRSSFQFRWSDSRLSKFRSDGQALAVRRY